MSTVLAAQMYTLRKFTQTPADIARTLRKVRDIGYEAIQISAFGPCDPSELAKMLGETGLTVCSTHTAWPRFVGEIDAVIAEHCPDVVAVETAFYHKSARSTLVLGHVRGVVLLAAREAGLPVDEYAPREIKMAVTGSGAAAKEQVAFMVKGLLELPEPPSLDASDALAVALCHWHRSRLPA